MDLRLAAARFLTGSLDNVQHVCWDRPVTPRALLLDPFWVGRRADAFDEHCR